MQKKRDFDTVRYIANQSQDLSINMKGLKDLAMEVVAYMVHNNDNENFKAITYNYVRLSTEFHPDKYDKRAADWLFILNTLNFGFWTRKDMKEWKIDQFTGYMALCVAIKRAIDDGKPMWDPKFYTKLSKAEMIHIFRGDDNTVIPRVSRRLTILRKVGNILLNSYDGTFANCIRSCNKNAIALMTIIHDKFPSYRDVAKYDERSVYLYTKTWILVADIWAFFDFKHELYIELDKMIYPTMYTDYRFLQVFKHFNAVIYSKKFSDELEKGDKFLAQGSKEELEIRCCSFLMVKYLHETLMVTIERYEYGEQIPGIKFQDFDCTCLIDNFLWDYRQLHDEQLKKNLLCKIYTEQY